MRFAEMDSLSEGFGVSPGGRGSLINDLFKKIASAAGWDQLPERVRRPGGDRMTQYIVEEEFARVNISWIGRQRGAAILAAERKSRSGTYSEADQREYSFALGFTEPHAGADLASAMPAVRDGDEYVINGQKMYTRGAYGTHIYLMAGPIRTCRSIGDLDLPVSDGHAGHHVRPLWTIQNDPPAPSVRHMARRAPMRRSSTTCASGKLHVGRENEGWRVGAMA